MTDYIKTIKEKINSHKSLAIISLIVIVFLFLAQMLGAVTTFGNLLFPPISDIDDNTLKEQAKTLADDIYFFVQDRRDNEPEIDFDDWETSIQNLSEYDNETKALFRVRFNQRLADIKEEFSIRKITDEKFEMHYQFPTNYIVIEIIGLSLNAMASQL